MAEGLNPEGVITPFGAFSQAAWAPEGRLLFISGQVANAADGQLIGAGDVRAQARQVLTNISTILASVGGTLEDVVTVNVFLVSVQDLPAVHEVRREFFKPPYPASTLIQVAALARPELLVEINAVAAIKAPVSG
jgi:reactive intermediate/imine deaminase